MAPLGWTGHPRRLLAAARRWRTGSLGRTQSLGIAEAVPLSKGLLMTTAWGISMAARISTGLQAPSDGVFERFPLDYLLWPGLSDQGHTHVVKFGIELLRRHPRAMHWEGG